MLTTPAIHIRVASPHEDSLIAMHFYQMWLDLDVPAQAIHADWLNLSLQFIEQAQPVAAIHRTGSSRFVLHSICCRG